MKRMSGLVLGSCLAVTGALGAACSSESEDAPQGTAGKAAAGTAGQEPGGAGGVGAAAGAGGVAGAAGGAGGAGAGNECQSGLQVIEQVETEVLGLVSWSESRRFGVNGLSEIVIYQVETDGSIARVSAVTPADFDAEGSLFTSVAAYGTGFVATLVEQVANAEAKLVHWSADGTTEELLSEPGRYMTLGAASEAAGIAVAAGVGDRAVYVATAENEAWAWAAPIAHTGRRLSPLAFGGDGHLLVAVEEVARGQGTGGAGGAGGADGGGDARVEIWNEGALIESHRTFGNPSVALAVGEAGWLFGETNSFWGSYNASLELLGESGELVELSKVPVISAGDGEDGARDLALLGERLLVANCESGLLAAPWSTTSVELEDAPGPWGGREGLGDCTTEHIETVAGVVALAGNGKLTFARACE